MVSSLLLIFFSSLLFNNLASKLCCGGQAFSIAGEAPLSSAFWGSWLRHSLPTQTCNKRQVNKRRTCCAVLSRVQLFATPWTVAPFLCPWGYPSKNTGVGCCFLLQGIFPTQGSNSGLLHCRQILYHLSHLGRPQENSNSPKWPKLTP